MTRFYSFLFYKLPAIACAIGLGAAQAFAADPLPPSANAEIERARATLERGGLSEAQASTASAALDSAAAFEDQAQSAIDASGALLEAVATANREQTGLERALEISTTDTFRAWRSTLPANIAGAELETRLEAERAEVQRLRAEVSDFRGALSTQSSNALADIERNAELQLQIEALQRSLDAPPANGSDLPLAVQQAQQATQRAELRALSAELARGTLDRETAPLRRTHLELKLRRAQRDLGDHEQRVEVLQAISSLQQTDSLQPLLARLEAEAKVHAEGDSLLHLAAKDTLSLGRDLAATTRALIELQEDESARANARDGVAAALRDTRARLAVEGQDDSLGQILVLERRRLGSPDVVARRLDEVRQSLTRARLQLIALAGQRVALADISGAVVNAVDSVEAASESEAADLRSQLHTLLGERAELLPRLDIALQRYITALTLAENTLQAQLVDMLAVRELLDRRIYWIPSNGSIDLAWMSRVSAGWADLFKPARFMTSIELLRERVISHPLIPSLIVLAFIALMLVRVRAQALTELTVPLLRRPQEDRYALSWQALAVAIAASLPWALLIWGTGHVLISVGEPGRFSDSLGHSLIALSGSLLLLEFLRFLVVEHGLAHLHFRWMRDRRQAIARAAPLAILLLLPLQFVVGLALIRNQELAIDTAARCALIACCAIVGFMLYRLLAPNALWATRGGMPEPRRLRQMLRIGLPVLFFYLAMMIVSGYVYSGAIILNCLWLTLGTVAAVGVIHGMLSRWFLLGERRLAANRSEARKLAAAQEVASTGSDESAADVSEEMIALETVNVQTGRLLRATTLALWVGGLYLVWSEVLPALGRLDETVLWHVAGKAEDGSALSEAISLRSVLLGVLTLMLTTVAARNLPGLMELGMLSRTNINPASRYAITAMSRYAIVIVGSVIGLGLLGLRWSQLQWMAAALSVGLGFGLQEIFANFVSGLILLSERPFRVGDIITIADQTGTVTRISTRATTLLDFDGKELVVPNKTFITDRLVNWTLTDTKTRIVIKVGVAYGTPPERVHMLLQRIANEHPLVLQDPAPRSWFMAFGASTLDFELRVFVAAVADRLPVMSEINMGIANLFASNGIEIAFPQMDLHVRTVTPKPITDAADSAHPGDAEHAMSSG